MSHCKECPECSCKRGEWSNEYIQLYTDKSMYVYLDNGHTEKIDPKHVKELYLALKGMFDPED